MPPSTRGAHSGTPVRARALHRGTARGASCLLAAATALPLLTSPASAAQDGSWWFTATGIDRAQREAKGEGVVIALVDGAVNPDAAELRGQRLEPAKTYCDDASSPFSRKATAFHPTSMAALMIGSGRGTLPGGSGIRGVAPEATVRVYAADGSRPGFQCDKKGDRGTTEDIAQQSTAQAVRDAVDDGAEVVSLPFLTGGSAIRNAASYAVTRGAVVVAGIDTRINPELGIAQDGIIGNIAQVPGVVSVTAVDRKGRQWDEAGNGSSLLVAAPGVDIGSGSVDASGRWSSAGTATGTSASTAIVSAMVAVVKSKYPSATGAQLVQCLVRNTTRGKLSHDPYLGFGIASLPAMLADDPTLLPDDNPFRHTAAQFVAEDYPERLTSTKDRPAPLESFPEVYVGREVQPLSVLPPGVDVSGFEALRQRFLPTGKTPAAPAPTAAPPAAAAPAAEPARPAAAEADSGRSLTPLLAGGALALLLVVGGALLARARRRPSPAHPQRGS